MRNIPTLQELYNDLITSIENQFGITIPTFGKNVFRAISASYAGKLKIIHLHIGKVQDNIFIDTADPVSQGGTLERFGQVKLGRGPFPAVAGQYEVAVTGDPGSTIAAQTTFKSDDGSSAPGYLYILDEEYTMTGSGDVITLRALTAGTESQLQQNDTLTSTVPISGVESGATVSSEVVEPIDAESTEEYRQKGIDAYRQEPQGGAATDYRLWAADAQGVAKVYPYAKPGDDGIIDLYVEATKSSSTDNKGTPSAALLDDVEEVIELDPDTTKPTNERGRRPLGVFQVNYLPITPLDIGIEIQGGSYTSDQEAAIEAALIEMIDMIRPFVTGADLVSELNDTLDNNRVVFTIQSTVPAVTFTGVQITVDGSPEVSYQFTAGNIPFINEVLITFV